MRILNPGHRSARRAAVLGAVLAVAAVNTGTAAAATAVRSATDHYTGCVGYLEVVSNWNGSGHDGVYGDFFGPSGIHTTNFQCTEYLERSTDGGSTWSLLTSYHYVKPYQETTTGTYWDGPGYEARVCVEPTATDGPWYENAICSTGY